MTFIKTKLALLILFRLCEVKLCVKKNSPFLDTWLAVTLQECKLNQALTFTGMQKYRMLDIGFKNVNCEMNAK